MRPTSKGERTPEARSRPGVDTGTAPENRSLGGEQSKDSPEAAFSQERFPLPKWRANATGETSREAAIVAAKVAPKQAALAYGVIAELGSASPEEVVSILRARGHFVLLTSIRARICGLRRMGLVVDSGLRGVGESKRCAVIRWRLATPEEREAWELAKAAAQQEDAPEERA